MKIVGREISINKGDRATIRLKRKEGNFAVNDKIKFSIIDKSNYNKVMLQKTFVVTEQSQYAYITLTKEDMKIGDVIKESKEYRYEIEYNDDITLIGANENDDNVLLLYAEAGDK